MSIKLKPIDQQVVVVFGASSGIGRGAALEFARRGAKVVVAARGKSGLRTLAEEIRQAGGTALAVQADATNLDQVRAVAVQAVAEYGRIDTWVQLAAVSVYAPFRETTPEEFRHVIDVNLIGQANAAWAALPHLAKRGGALIMVSSVEGRRALPYHSAYAASKHGVNALADTLRMELAHDGAPVSVTTIMPPSVNTPFFDKARTKLGVKPTGLPPVYPPSAVVEAIVHAAQRPAREIVVGAAGKAIDYSQRLSPALTDALIARIAFAGQRTDEPKADTAPDSLFAPLSGYDRVEGTIGSTPLAGALARLNLSPGQQRVAGMALLAGAALLLDRIRPG